MLRKIAALFAAVLCLGLVVSCSQSINDVTETTNDTTAYTPTENVEQIPADQIFLNPDGEEFAYKLCSYDKDSTEPNIQYWDTGKELVKFEWYPGEVFKINDRVINCFGIYIKQILVEDEYIIVIPGGTDINSSPVYICDYPGNILFKTYYLSNTGMVNAGKVNVIDNKIIINGTRFTHGPSITIGINSHWLEDFSEYSDYLYEDTVYDYGDNFRLPYEVYLDESNEEEIKILNPNEKVSAVFEMEYLGSGKFSNLKMVEHQTLGTFLDSYLDLEYNTITDLQSSVKLEYTQYTSDSYESHLPAESDYTMINQISSYQATILGNDSRCEIFEYTMLDNSVKRYIICTAVDTDTILFQGEGTVIDINGDNDNEIISNDHLLINTANGIMVSNMTAAFDNYLQSILPKDAEYEFHLGFDGNYNIFSYTVYTQDENAYEQHDIQIQLENNRFDFVYENTYFRDIYAPFESNDPDWSVEVSFTDITNPQNIPGFDEYVFKLYTLTLSGPENKQFKIYGDYDLPLDNAVFINTNEYQDARFQRKLIVHPQYDYAILMYPFAAQTADDVDKTIASLIDLSTGRIIGSQSGIEEAAFCPYNPYYLFESAEEASRELNKYDFMGNNIHSITLDAEVISNGFEITAHLHDSSGEIIRNKVFVVDLTTMSHSFS